MSLLRGSPAESEYGFPRVSGDEPQKQQRTPAEAGFSPRERG